MGFVSENRQIVVAADSGDEAAEKAVAEFHNSDYFNENRNTIGRFIVNKVEPYVEDISEQVEVLSELLQVKKVVEKEARRPKKTKKKVSKPVVEEEPAAVEGSE